MSPRPVQLPRPPITIAAHGPIGLRLVAQHADSWNSVPPRDQTMAAAIESLKKKGYFTPRPRPWKLGLRDRGLGRGNFAILDKFDDLVAEVESRVDAELIISAANLYPLEEDAPPT